MARDNFCIILPNRYYISSTTQTTKELISFNSDLFNQIDGTPARAEEIVGPNPADLYKLLLHRTSFIDQVNNINILLKRLGFEEIKLVGLQQTNIDNININKHGSGLRCVIPILAALTSDHIDVIIIDEPELSLEARIQKVLKDILIESGKTIVVATQSHLFLNRKKLESNFIVTNEGNTKIKQLGSENDLLDLTYNLLGNSLADLYFPSNFLIVEGVSDQIICEKIMDLLNIESRKVKVISAKGIDNIGPSYQAIKNTLIPLIVNTPPSPYSDKVTVLVDTYHDKKHLDELERNLKDRFFVLDQQSIEEYIPEIIYAKAGMDKEKKLLEITNNKSDFDKLNKIKKDISVAIVSVLEEVDLKYVPIIVKAIKTAEEKIK
jgi:predicted ATP-dependent endonuclease of OLD family